jgi:hypothetical protein
MVPALTEQLLDQLLCDETASESDAHVQFDESRGAKDLCHGDLRNMLIAYLPSEDLPPMPLDSHTLFEDRDAVMIGLSRSSSVDVNNAPSVEESLETESLDDRSSVLSFLSDQEESQGEIDVELPERAMNPTDASPTFEPSQEAANASFLTLRITYLLITLVIMLADGLQGTLIRQRQSVLLSHVSNPVGCHNGLQAPIFTFYMRGTASRSPTCIALGLPRVV